MSRCSAWARSTCSACSRSPSSGGCPGPSPSPSRACSPSTGSSCRRSTRSRSPTRATGSRSACSSRPASSSASSPRGCAARRASRRCSPRSRPRCSSTATSAGSSTGSPPRLPAPSRSSARRSSSGRRPSGRGRRGGARAGGRWAPRSGRSTWPGGAAAARARAGGCCRRWRRCSAWPIDRERLAGEAFEAEALRRSDSLKTALLRAVSHDLRTPLMGILTSASALAQGELVLDEADRADLLATVLDEAHRLDRLVGNLLDLSRLQAGRRPARARARGRRRSRRSRPWTSWARDGARVEVTLADEPAAVQVDSHQIQRALVNLIENALKYSPPDAPVHVRVAVTSSEVAVRVIDQGPGVAARRARPDLRAVPAGLGSAAVRGAGLGLAIAQGFAEANGGRISVESRSGQGATFVLTLPVAKVAVEAERRAGSERDSRRRRRGADPAGAAHQPARRGLRGRDGGDGRGGPRRGGDAAARRGHPRPGAARQHGDRGLPRAPQVDVGARDRALGGRRGEREGRRARRGRRRLRHQAGRDRRAAGPAAGEPAAGRAVGRAAGRRSASSRSISRSKRCGSAASRCI